MENDLRKLFSCGAAMGMMWLTLCLSNIATAQEARIEEARELHARAVELFGAGKFQDGVPIAERALQIREQVLGSEHPDTTASMRNLGQFYRVTGSYSKAEALCVRTLEIRESTAGLEHPTTAESLSDLALIYTIAGAYSKAEPLYQRALSITQKVLGDEHPSTARSLNLLATMYRNMGRYLQAGPLAERALAIREKVLGPKHRLTAVSLQDLAGLYLRTGAYARAEQLYQRALAIREEVSGTEHAETTETLIGFGLLYIETGAYSKAITLLQRAVAIREKAGLEDENTAGVLNNLAIAHHRAGDTMKAEQFHERTLALRERLLGPSHPQVANSLTNLASLHAELGRSARAEAYYQRSLLITETLYGQKHPDITATLNNLANLHRRVGDYPKAESLYLRALTINESVFGLQHQRTGGSLRNLALLQWARDNQPKALSLMQRAQAIEVRNSARFLASGSDSRKQAYLDSSYDDVSRNVSFSIANGSRAGVALGFTSVLQHKGRALDAMSDSVARLRQSVRLEDRAVFERLAETAAELSMLSYQGSGKTQPQAYRKRIEELYERQESLEAQLARNSSEFRQQVTPVTLAAVRAAMPADAVLVEWLRYQPYDPRAKSVQAQFGPARYVAYVLRRSGDPTVVDLGGADAIESLARDFRLAASDSQRSDVRQHAAALSKRVIEPLRSHISGARHLLISPDGALNLVPVAALVDEDERYLAERYEITFLTSARDLLRVAAPSAALSSNPVVMAAPDYGQRVRLAQADAPTRLLQERSEELDRAGLAFRSLPGTALEAEALKGLLGAEGAHVFTGAEASETNLKRVHGPRILHLATHGFFLNDQQARTAVSPTSAQQSAEIGIENPLLRSGLALAGANQRRSGLIDDGILTALEASRLDLRGTELVVLSACETGIGEVRNGSGVTGLRRGLFLAGAQTQISSLWKVADLSTQELMVSFYRRLVKGDGRSAALRRAQLEMRAKPDQSHPYYWASFVVIGDWTALSQ